MKKATWMTILSEHYHNARDQHPDEHLLVLFDIDDTIIDVRPIFRLMLTAYDQRHGTRYFDSLSIEDISLQEEVLENLLLNLEIPSDERDSINSWVNGYDWAQSDVLKAHQPFNGVLEMIRWFQIQPNTSVGLVTGRSERMRSATLQILNMLGESYRVNFSSEMLFLRPDDWKGDVPSSKKEGLHHFQDRGYRVIAFIDNEPENLEAVSEADPEGEILLLHAETMFASRRDRLPKRAVSGREYLLSELIPENQALPDRVHMVWNGVNNQQNLDQFLESDVFWGKLDVRTGVDNHECILRADSFLSHPPRRGETWLNFSDTFQQFLEAGKGINIHLTEGKPLLIKVAQELVESGMDNKRLWFSGDLVSTGKTIFEHINEMFPGSVVQCDVDFLVPMILSMPRQAHRILNEISGWGVNLFSLNWKPAYPGKIINILDEWGIPVNLQNIPDLEGFLQAVYLMPYSVTADFNFPEWNYFGAGAGEDGYFYTYPRFASFPQAR